MLRRMNDQMISHEAKLKNNLERELLASPYEVIVEKWLLKTAFAPTASTVS